MSFSGDGCVCVSVCMCVCVFAHVYVSCLFLVVCVCVCVWVCVCYHAPLLECVLVGCGTQGERPKLHQHFNWSRENSWSTDPERTGAGHLREREREHLSWTPERETDRMKVVMLSVFFF